MLNQEQLDLLQSRYVSRAKFTVNGVEFDCWEGEWKVTKNNKVLDIYTFRLYKHDELMEELERIFS